MMDNIAETKSVNIKDSDKISLIIDSKFLTLTGPWHFDEDIEGAKVNLNEIKTDFNYLINVMGSNHLVHPDDHDYSKHLLRELEAGKSIDYHFKVITPHAEVRLIHGYGSSLSAESLQSRVADWDETTNALEMHLKLFKYAEEVADIGSWTWNLETDAFQVSDNCFRLYGLVPQSIVPTWEVLFRYAHPDDVNKLIDARRFMHETSKPVNLSYRIIRSDGSVRYIKLKSDFFVSRKGARHFIGCILDVTEQKVTQQQTHDALQAMQSTLDAIPQMMWVYNLKTNQFIFNDRWYNYTGLTPEQCHHFDPQKLHVFHPSQEDEHKQKWNDCIKHGVAYSGETLIRSYHGEFRWYLDQSVPVKNDSGQIEYWIGTFTDVHEQFVSEKKLKESTALLEAIFNSSSNGIEVLDAIHDPSTNDVIDFTWRYHNQAAKKIRNVGNLTGRQFSKECPAKIKSSMMERMREVMRTGKSAQFEQQYHINNRYSRWLDISIVKLEDSLILNTHDVTERKVVEIELQKSKHFIQQITNSTPDIVYVLDILTQSVMYVSSRVSSVFGSSEESIYNDASTVFTKYLHPDDFGRRMRHIQELTTIKDDETREIDLRLKVADGSWRWFKIRDTIFKRKHDGSVWLTIGLVQDVDDQRNAEKKIFLQHQLDRQAEKIANIGNWRMNTLTGQSIWSDNFYRLLEHDPGAVEPTLQNFLASVHPDDKPLILQQANRINQQAEGTLSIYDFRVLKKGGDVRYLRSASEQVVLDGERSIIGTVHDVTDEVLLQQNLKERIAFIETVIESSIDRIIVIDKAYKIMTWNRSCEKNYNLSKADVLGQHIFQVFPEIGKNSLLKEQYRKAFDGESVQLHNVHDVYYEGYFEAFLIPLKNEVGEIYGVLSIIHDITEHVNVQVQMQKLNDVLIEKNLTLKSLNDELATFAFIASHDLREPLRKIQVFSKTLIDVEENLSDKGKEYCKRVIASAARMNNLIDDILTFSKATAEAKKAEVFDLNDLVKNVLQNLEAKIKEKQATIECDKLPVFKGHSIQISQLIQNLIINALKFQRWDKSPHIKISGTFLYGEEIDHFQSRHGRKYFSLKIADNGIGFEQQYAEKIFQMFQRLHSAAEFPGTGIGLAICKKIADNHDGFITAEGQPNQGAVFTCYFPV